MVTTTDGAPGRTQQVPAPSGPRDPGARRAAVLRDLDLLDRPAAAELDAVVRLATTVTGLPHAVVNLHDDVCQLPLLVSDGARVPVVPRAEALCAQVVEDAELYASADLTAEPRFAGHPFVDGRRARVRAYVSAPLRSSEGVAFGTLCAYGFQPRAVDAAQAAALTDLAVVAVGILERGRCVRQAAELATEAHDAREVAVRASAELSRARAFDAALLDSLSVGVLAADADGRITVVNRAMRTWIGGEWDEARLEEGLRRSTAHLYAADGVTPVDPTRTPLQRAVRGEDVQDVELVADVPGGRRRVQLAGARSIRTTDGTPLGAVVTVTDVTAQRDLEARLREAALHDPLTGLPNRALLLDRVEHALRVQEREGLPAALLYCDLDGFKAINDTLGHAAGDAALLRMTATLTAVVRPGDTVARIGGDEFVVLCPGTTGEAVARGLVDRIAAGLAAPADGGPPLRTSTGLTLSRRGDDADSLLRRADAAMYEVKRSRR